MQKARNILVALVFTLFLLGPLCVFSAEKLHIDLPSNLTAEDSRWLSGGLEDAHVKENASIQGFASKLFQSALETEINNRIPTKTTALLTYASVQRNAISLSNALFKWECYSTFFGSERLYIPSHNSLTYRPCYKNEQYYQSLEAFAYGVNEFGKRHPNKRIILYVVQGKETPQFNPAYSLMSNPIDAQSALDVFQNTINADNVYLCTDNYESLTDYYEHFFKSDHHWNITGATQAYNTMAEKLGLDSFESQGLYSVSDLPSYGSNARVGLYLIEDETLDDNHNYSNLLIQESDDSTMPYGHYYFDNADKLDKVFLFYDHYFAFPLHTLVNTKTENYQSALLVSNSYGGALRCLIANQYKITTIGDQLYGDRINSNDRLENLLQIENDTEVDDIFLVAHPNDAVEIIQKCPRFFSNG